MNKQKIIITLFFVGLSLFFINSVDAQIINGDFSSGCTGWTFSKTGTGFYGCEYERANFKANTNSGSVTLTQNTDFTNYTQLNFIAWAQYNDGIPIYAYIDNVLVYTNFYWWNGGTGTRIGTIDVSGITGIKELKFYYPYGNTASSKIYMVDNVNLEYIEPPNSITFYPDVTETENFPFIVNYTVNASCNGLNQIYVYRDDYHIYTYYLGNTAEGSVNMSDLIRPSENMSYTVTLRTISCNVIAFDMIDYIFNESSPEFPDPDPTPDITPLPTYTPPPTPIPPDNPITPNNTLNTSWYQGYISLVDSCINGLFNPIYNATAHFMYPTIVLTTTGANLMIESEIIFAVVTEKILIATSIMEVFFNCLPDKLIYVMIYYLLWIVILLVFKGAA